MKTHWHLRYCNKTACGILAYPTNINNEYDTATNGRIECSEEPTCKSCQKVMRIGRYLSTFATSPLITKVDEEREARWKKALEYIKKTRTLEEAKKLAKRDGVRFNTSVWITAFGKMLEDG